MVLCHFSPHEQYKCIICSVYSCDNKLTRISVMRGTHRKFQAVQLHCCYNSVTCPWCRYWRVIKRLKIAESWLTVLCSDRLAAVLTEDLRAITPAGHSRGGRGVNWRTSPLLSSLVFPPLFPVSLVNAFFFQGPSDGIPPSVSCCLRWLLWNHGNHPVLRIFLLTYVTGDNNVMGSSYGWYVQFFYVDILIYGQN